MKIYLGITDTHWFEYLRKAKPEDVNFWQPGGHSSFKLLEQGEPFLFKLKYPINKIGGVGFFVNHMYLPLSYAWSLFGKNNGCETFSEFESIILHYRREAKSISSNPVIGCIILTSPVFFEDKDMIPSPDDWSPHIVSGKSYSTDSPIGRDIWEKIEERFNLYINNKTGGKDILIREPSKNKYGNYITKVRLGQGSFRALVTDIYDRRCAISGEKTLPVLEASHIKPYAESGPHALQNGILLRSDFHKLFDTGYLKITKDYHVEVSKRIKDEYENGSEYYKYHGKKLTVIPSKTQNKPSAEYLSWHNENVFRS